LNYSTFDVKVDYINTLLGLDLSIEQMQNCVLKMGLYIKDVCENKTKLTVEVPPTRCDILHACDIAEDIGIAYGYNHIPKVFPPTNTIGKQIPQNKFTDLLRHEIAQAGYIECLTMSLISIKENYQFLRKEPNLEEAVQIANPKTVEFEIVRTSLIPGLLKTLQSNSSESVSILTNLTTLYIVTLEVI
jgi:phenylalanyl-tRNA synthetase beta chain